MSYVQLGNILAGRSAVLALLAWAVGGMPILEQPLRSVMTALPAWQSVIAYFDEAEQQGWTGQRLKLNQVFMACFKAPTLKPTALYSTESFDPLMNMKVPPKDQRPQPDAQVTYQCHALDECVCMSFLVGMGIFLYWDFLGRRCFLLDRNACCKGIKMHPAARESRAVQGSRRHSCTHPNSEGRWPVGGWLMGLSLPGPHAERI